MWWLHFVLSLCLPVWYDGEGKGVNNLNLAFFSIVMSSVALLISVLSPAFVALINNKHEKTMYELRHYDEMADQTITAFVETLGMFMGDHIRSQDFTTLYRTTGKMYIYTPKNQWKYLDLVSKYAMTKQGYEKVEAGYCDFCKSIAKWKSQKQ